MRSETDMRKAMRMMKQEWTPFIGQMVVHTEFNGSRYLIVRIMPGGTFVLRDMVTSEQVAVPLNKYRPATFAEFLFNPTGFGKWGKSGYMVLLAMAIPCALSLGWALAMVPVLGLTLWQHHRQWRGKQV